MQVETTTKKRITISDSEIRSAILALLYEANQISEIGEIHPASIKFSVIEDEFDITEVSAYLEITKTTA
jgi:hypothetical protein